MAVNIIILFIHELCMLFAVLCIGRLKVLDYLINELALDGVARDKDMMSCVHAATQGNHPTTVKVFDLVLSCLKLGPIRMLQKQFKNLPTIFYTIIPTQWLVNKLGNSFITDKTSDGATPLHMAACKRPRPLPSHPPHILHTTHTQHKAMWKYSSSF